MAPALTQSAEPPTLAEASRYSPPPLSTATSLDSPSHYISLAKKRSFFDLDPFLPLHFKACSPVKLGHLSHRRLLIPNGDCRSPVLAPPASGWVEGRPTSSPPSRNMDVPSPLQAQDRRASNGIEEPSRYHRSEDNSANPGRNNISMGSQAAIVGSLSIPMEVTSKAEALTDDPSTLNSQNELLALMGRDFNSVKDIMDTLHKLASNPELLGDLEPPSTGVGVQPSTTVLSAEEKAIVFLSRLTDRQRHLERRRRFLLRRLHRVSARGLGITFSSQLNSLIRHGRKTIVEDKARHESESIKCESERMGIEQQKQHQPLPLDSLHTESMKSMSTSDLVNLVRRVEASQNNHRKNVSICSKSNQPLYVSRTLPTALCHEVNVVRTAMGVAVQSHLNHDSDATESSSGGESCDENDTYRRDHVEPNSKPIMDRALYQYCRVRGWVASRWSWLQAQIKDLDHRIKQQKKNNAIIQASKGEVELCCDEFRNRLPVRDPAHYSSQDPAFTCTTLPPLHRHAINGYHPSPPKLDEFFDSAHNEFQNKGCSRTLGTKRVRRRKYVRLNKPLSVHSHRSHLYSSGNSNSSCIGSPFNCGTGISPSNKFRCKVLDIKCGCAKPLSCIVCVKAQSINSTTMRTNCLPYTSINPNFSTMVRLSQSLTEKCARIDSSFHPVLSQPSEISQSLYISDFLSNVEWPHAQTKTEPEERAPTPIDIVGHREIVSHTSCNEDEEISVSDSEPLTKRRRKNRLRRRDGKGGILMINNRKSLLKEEDDPELSSWSIPPGSGSNTPSPCPSPAPPPDKERERLLVNHIEKSLDNRGPLRRTSQANKSNKTLSTNSMSYDIDNIVIPYSMAASTKLEMLHCKEIPTPKWRIVDEMPAEVEDTSDFEDVSEACIIARHKRSEEEERHRFLKYLQGHVHSRQSRTRRTDSSGTNTPDQPLSPRPSFEPGDLQTPVGSPPPTTGSEDSNQSTSMSRSIPKQSPSTVLTLSLSSIRSSLLKSDNFELHQHEAMTIGENLSSPNGPQLRSFRSLSENGLDVNSHSQMGKHGRVSPFCSRAFPLDERECRKLDVMEAIHSELKMPLLRSRSSIATNLDSSNMHGRNQRLNSTENIVSTIRITSEDVSGDQSMLEDNESGRSTPLSELTASANSADEIEWSDEGKADKNPPDFTIRALKDNKGGLLMQVMRNKETPMA